MIVLLVLALGFAVFLGRLFANRFGLGDIYPAYSSLRTDRLGVKILSDSFEKAGYTVLRNYQPLQKASFAPPATYFFIGLADFADPSPFQGKNQEQLLSLLDQGNRVVITLLPVGRRDKKDQEGADKGKGEGAGESPAGQDQGKEVPAPETEEVEGEEGQETLAQVFDFAVEIPEQEKGASPPLPGSARGRLGDTALDIPWNSAAAFSSLAEPWRTVLAVNDLPVMVERAWGRGTLVLATDSAFLGNETLWSQRSPLLLAWLPGGNRAVIFDEAHLGLRQQLSISRLIRDFNLHWVIIALAVPALLFIRRSSVPLVPAPPEETRIPQAEGRDHFSGLVCLLRQHPPDNLLSVCLALRLKSDRGVRDREAMEQIAQETTSTSIVMNYNIIARLLQIGSHSDGTTLNRK